MNGLEMMLSRMIGMTPEQMRQKVEQAVSLMEQGAKTMAQLQSDMNKIKSHLGIDETEETASVGAIANASNRNSASNHPVQL